MIDEFSDYYIPPEALEKLEDPEYLEQCIAEGKTFQEILGYTDELMQEMYSNARHHLENEDFENAAAAFVFLTTLNPHIHEYWMGLGMSEQLRGEYETALVAYRMAILTQEDNPILYYHMAACYTAQEDYENAKDCLNLVITHSGNNGEFANIRKSATELLRKISNQ